MRLLYFIVFLATFYPFEYTYGQSSQVTKEALIKDIDFYKEGIIRKHVNPFKNISKEDFLNGIEKIKEDAVNQNADEIIISLRRLNAKLLDEHSNIGGFSKAKFFPLIFYWFDEGIYIIQIDQANSKLLYSKLVAINNMPVEKIAKEMTDIFPDRNEFSIRENVQGRLPSTLVLHGLDIIDNIDAANFTLINHNGDTIVATLKSKNNNEIRFFDDQIAHSFLRSSQKGNYWYRYDESKNYIYFNYAECTNDAAYPFSQFQEDFFKVLKNKRPSKVIIDLRDNSGGVRKLLQPFIFELSETNFSTGDVYVLTGRKTFSAGLNNIYDLAKLIHITTVGEPTGGSINHFGQVKSFKLPNSGLTVSYSSNYIVNDPTKNGSYVPQTVIKESLADYMHGKDAALNYAIEH